MKMKSFMVLVFLFTILAQAACAPSGPAAPANPCPTPTADTRLLTNTKDGYCLLYPAEDSADLPGLIVINPASGPTDIPGDAWVNIQVQDAAGRTAAQAADEAIADAGPGFDITRTEITVDGEQAIAVDGIPAFDVNRMVYIVRNDRLYILAFLPWHPGDGQTTPLEHLYQTILGSIHFLPPAQGQ